MKKFALISEGITDQVVLESILGAHYKGEEFSLNILQPLRDETDVSRQSKNSFGGWEQVLEYVSFPEKIDDVLQVNDYLIIHIDSDICWHDSVDIDHAQDCASLVAAIRNFVIEKIQLEYFEIFEKNIIFAIPIHSIECWLIPLHTKHQRHLKEKKNCEETLFLVGGLPGMKKDFESYSVLSKKLKRKKDFDFVYPHSPSLKIFVDALPII